jgi:predicted secreted protein
MRSRTLAVSTLWLVGALGVACSHPPLAVADSSEDSMNRAHFEVERARKVANDRITAIVGVTDEDSEASRLADRVNQTMRWALDQARGVESVEARSGSYHTHPIHQDGKIRRWRASQDLVLTSGDIEAMTALIGQLQTRLLVRSISFGVSDERRRAVQDELITESLEAYRKRAELIQEGLGARGFALVDLSIESPHHAPGPRIARMQAFDAEAAAPALEGGESEVAIRVHATIELED